MFIVIEGLDGCGKSSVAKALAAALGANCLSSPSSKFKDVRDELEMAYKGNSLGRQLFYMSTVLDVSNEVLKLKAEGKSVVLDRYWLSTQVYHDWKCDGKNLALLDVAAKLLIPDLTVYLDLPFTVRKQRITERSDNTPEDEKTLVPEDDSKLVGLYRDYSKGPIVGRWLIVDATQTIEFIVKNILQQLSYE